MSSSPIRFRAGFFGFVLAIVVLIAVLAVQRAVCTAADEPGSAGGHKLAMRIGRSSRPENGAQPPTRRNRASPPKRRKPTDSEKRAARRRRQSRRRRPALPRRSAADTVGEPLAAGMMELLQDEIVAGIKRRGITDRFARFQSYAIGQAQRLGRPIHGLGVGGQLPPEVVRPHDAQHAGGPGRGRAVHARVARGRLRRPRRAGQGVGHRGGEAGPERAQAAQARAADFARAGVGRDQAGADRGPGRLLRRLGAA